jgi:hypothetical protein
MSDEINDLLDQLAGAVSNKQLVVDLRAALAAKAPAAPAVSPAPAQTPAQPAV